MAPVATIASTEQTETLSWTDIPTHWIERFYPIYAEAQHTFNVNWLLIASIHKQESAFSTDPTTYYGLNFAGCCGGPMQFNVTNGPVTTWDIARGAFRRGRRPAVYGHRTTHHPSIYDDYDSIMAAAWLLSSDGAGLALDGSSWSAAYDYYGHDAAGVSYADEVLARAISWTQHGLCVNCSVQAGMVEAVHATYGVKQYTPRPRPRLRQDTRGGATLAGGPNSGARPRPGHTLAATRHAP
jgi:hypothetical protein